MTQKPGEVIRPVVSIEQAKELSKEIYGIDVAEIKEFVGYDDRNFLIYSNSANQHCILKVANSLDSSNLNNLKLQNKIMLILNKNDCKVQRPIAASDGELIHLKTFETLLSVDGTRGHRQHAVRLLTYLSGEVLGSSCMSGDLLEEVAFEVAHVDSLMTNYLKEDLMTCDRTLWSLLSVPKLNDFVYAVQGDDRQQLVRKVVKIFEDQVLSDQGLKILTPGCIHGDPNENNILVNQGSLSGILDWQDVGYQYYIFDLAILIMYTSYIFAKKSTNDKSPSIAQAFQLVVSPLVKGFVRGCPLSSQEMKFLPLLVAARFAQSLTLGEYSYRVIYPDNEYLMLTSGDSSWHCVQYLYDNLDKLADEWFVDL